MGKKPDFHELPVKFRLEMTAKGLAYENGPGTIVLSTSKI